MSNVETIILKPKEANGVVDYHLKLGNKHLIVSINRVSAFAETFIQNTDNERKPGSTTTLYKEAKRLLQLEAATCGPITYKASTGYPSMKNWLRTKGEYLFHWERLYSSVDDTEKIIAETIIYPE